MAEKEQPKGPRFDLWATEPISDYAGLRYYIEEQLYSKRSEFQQVDVVKTKGFGKMLFLDGLAMLSERDEYVYHDMITHVAMFVHPNPKRVLVIGGGDGGTVREVLRHTSVERCVMVEIDGDVVDVSKRFLPVTSCAFDNPKLELLIEDGVRYMAETEEKFDVILVDSTDPIGPAQPLFGPEFYANVKRVLSDDGIVVSQGESPNYGDLEQRSILDSVAKNFGHVFLYNYANLVYPGSHWSFVFASKKYHPIKDFDPQRVIDSGLEFRYYTPHMHRAAFALPRYQLNQVGQYLSEPGNGLD